MSNWDRQYQQLVYNCPLLRYIADAVIDCVRWVKETTQETQYVAIRICIKFDISSSYVNSWYRSLRYSHRRIITLRTASNSDKQL